MDEDCGSEETEAGCRSRTGRSQRGANGGRGQGGRGRFQRQKMPRQANGGTEASALAATWHLATVWATLSVAAPKAVPTEKLWRYSHFLHRIRQRRGVNNLPLSGQSAALAQAVTRAESRDPLNSQSINRKQIVVIWANRDSQRKIAPSQNTVITCSEVAALLQALPCFRRPLRRRGQHGGGRGHGLPAQGGRAARTEGPTAAGTRGKRPCVRAHVSLWPVSQSLPAPRRTRCGTMFFPNWKVSLFPHSTVAPGATSLNYSSAATRHTLCLFQQARYREPTVLQPNLSIDFHQGLLRQPAHLFAAHRYPQEARHLHH